MNVLEEATVKIKTGMIDVPVDCPICKDEGVIGSEFIVTLRSGEGETLVQRTYPACGRCVAYFPVNTGFFFKGAVADMGFEALSGIADSEL